MADPLHGYPRVLRAWFADSALPTDPGVDCARCPYQRASSDPTCCAFHPRLPNFLAGQALERGGPGAEQVRRRIALGTGVGPLWIEVGGWWDGTHDRCPYWVPGALSCSVWADRGATCRTYFCEGPQAGWRDLSTRLARAEHFLAQRCVLEGLPPSEGAPSAAWERWYRWCAAHVQSLDLPLPDLQQVPHQPDLTGRRRVEALPEVLVPTAPAFERHGDQVVFAVAASWARATYPAAVFALLAALDGQTSWGPAAAQAQISDATVDDLFRAGIVSAP